MVNEIENEDEFLKYIEGKTTDDFYEKEMNKVLLSLYGKGFIDVVMEDGEPMISISDTGHDAVLAEYALATMTPVEA